MNLIISLLYAPIVFYALKNFELKTISLFIFIFSFFWFLLNIKKRFQDFIFPIFYLIVSILAFFLNDFLLLQFLPTLISAFFTLFILYSYISNNSFIFIFLERFNKNVEQKEKDYIQKSTLFWFLASLLNLFIHCYILYIQDIIYWTYYSSFGWYFVFIIAGVIQFFHKKIYFDRKIYV